jgi:type II secretory pathway predicted ATPase ExeA
MLVTGDTGTGKTTLCRAVTEALGDRTFTAMILNPYMAGPEVLRIVLRDFGLVTHEELRQGKLAAADIPQLLDTLEGFLVSLIPLGSHAVIVLDEAQALDAAVLDQIRLLTALEHNRRCLVQVILCGQPSLLTTLKTDGLQALSDRITRRVELLPLPADQVKGYIDHRLTVAGGADAVSFEPDAVKVIAELSRGLPRRINVLCDRALQEGRIAGVSAITAELVKHAARALTGAASTLQPTPVPPPPAPVPSRPLVREEVAATKLREPSFGRSTAAVEPDEPAPPRDRRRIYALSAAGVIALAVAGYFWYGSTVLSSEAVLVPPRPTVAPVKDVGEYVLRRAAPPSDEELAVLLAPPAPSAYTPPSTPATIVPASPAPSSPPAPPSGQIP